MQYKGHTFGGVTSATKFYYDATPGYILDGESNVGEYGTDGYVYFDNSDYKWYDAGSGLPAKYTINDGRESYTSNFPTPAMTGSNVGATVRFWPSSGSVRFTFTQPDTSFFVEPGSDLWTQQAKLTASDAAANDAFGRDVAIKGDYVIIGSSNSGASYIFKKDTGAETWTQKAILTASDAGGTDYFGDNVSMSGDYVIVGAKGNDSSKGAAYIFMKDTGAETWTQQAHLIASDAANSDQFGW